MTTWRLLPFLAASGSVQMAIDTWLFQQHERGQHPPTLRFYTWQPAAISLGKLQKRWSPHWHTLSYEGEAIALVRRPTGGRAVLHQGDLTYAVVAPLQSRNTTEAYRHICTFLIQGWHTLGIDLHYGTAGRGYIHHASCFHTATAADLVRADGSKFIGSAQRRGKRTILQHGSMLLCPNKSLFEQVFQQVAPWRSPLCDRPPTPAAIAPIMHTLTAAAQQCFGITFVVQPLSDTEWLEISTFQADTSMHNE